MHVCIIFAFSKFFQLQESEIANPPSLTIVKQGDVVGELNNLLSITIITPPPFCYAFIGWGVVYTGGDPLQRGT